jgi:hypothetical protein
MTFDPKDWSKKARAYIAILAMGADKGALFPEEQQSAELKNQGQGLQNQGAAIDVQYAPATHEANIGQTRANTGLIGANTQQTALETQLMPAQAAAQNAASLASAASARQNVAESQALLPGQVRKQALEMEGAGYKNQADRVAAELAPRTGQAAIRGAEAEAALKEEQAKYYGQPKQTARRYREDDFVMAGSALDRLAGGVTEEFTGKFMPTEGATPRYPNLQDPGARAEVETAAAAIGEQNDLDLSTASLIAAKIDAGEYQLHPTADPNFYAIKTEGDGVIYVPAVVGDQFIDTGAVNPGVSE